MGSEAFPAFSFTITERQMPRKEYFMNNTQLQAQITRLNQNNQIMNVIFGTEPKQFLDFLKSYPYISLSLQNLMLASQLNAEIKNVLCVQKDGKEKSLETWKVIQDGLTEAMNLTTSLRMGSGMMGQMGFSNMQPQTSMFMNAGNPMAPNATTDVNQIRNYISSVLGSMYSVDPLIFLQSLIRRNVVLDFKSFKDLLRRALAESITSLPEYQFGAVLSIFLGNQFQPMGFQSCNQQMQNQGFVPPMMGGMPMWGQPAMNPFLQSQPGMPSNNDMSFSA